MQAGSGSLCLYMLEGAFPLESPLTIYHSRRISCQWKPFGVGSGLGLLTGVSPSRKKPAGVAQKARAGVSLGSPRESGGLWPQPQKRAAPCSEPPRAGGSLRGARWAGGGLILRPSFSTEKIKAGLEILPSLPQACSVQG